MILSTLFSLSPYQIKHFFSGFIGALAAQWNVSEKWTELLTAPFTRCCGGECGSLRIR